MRPAQLRAHEPPLAARSWPAGVGAGLRRPDVFFAEAQCNELSVAPTKVGAYARSSPCDASETCCRLHDRTRGVRLFLVAALAFTATLLATSPASAQMKPDTAGIATQDIAVDARPIARFARGSAPKVMRRLEWRGGLVLTSRSKYFGGWSGLILSDDGTRLTAVSDSGIWMTGELTYDDDDRPKAMRAARIGPLLTLKGGPLSRTRDRDAEAMALAGGSLTQGKALIAFEQNDRIGVFPLGKGGVGKPTSYLTMPKEAARMRMDGIEALTVIAGGRQKGAVVAFTENPLRGEKQHRGWIWQAGEPRGFTVAGIAGYGITDAASLPDGSLLLVERRFRWLEGLRIRLRHIAAGAIAPGAAVAGDVLLEADMSQEIDNLEAIAVSRDADGKTVVTLLSDDNYNRFLQRTVLLQFTLTDAAEANAASAER